MSEHNSVITNYSSMWTIMSVAWITSYSFDFERSKKKEFTAVNSDRNLVDCKFNLWLKLRSDSFIAYVSYELSFPPFFSLHLGNVSKDRVREMPVNGRMICFFFIFFITTTSINRGNDSYLYVQLVNVSQIFNWIMHNFVYFETFRHNRILLQYNRYYFWLTEHFPGFWKEIPSFFFTCSWNKKNVVYWFVNLI